MSGSILAIETSCDETGVGIVRGTTLLANAVASSPEPRMTNALPSSAS